MGHTKRKIELDSDMSKQDSKAGNEELIPSEFADRLIDGENPIRVWREYRKMTQATLAKTIGISTPYLSQLENEDRTPSLEVLKNIAETLDISLDDLV